MASYLSDARSIGCGESLALVGRRFKLALYPLRRAGGGGGCAGGRCAAPPRVRLTSLPHEAEAYTGLLYDLQHDPHELRDRFCDAGWGGLRRGLSAALLRWHWANVRLGEALRSGSRVLRGEAVWPRFKSELSAPDAALDDEVGALEAAWRGEQAEPPGARLPACEFQPSAPGAFLRV